MNPEAEVASIARAQHGMVTRAQLRAAGVSRRAITAHLDNGWLVRRHAGVYQLGVFAGPVRRRACRTARVRVASRPHPLDLGVRVRARASRPRM